MRAADNKGPLPSSPPHFSHLPANESASALDNPQHAYRKRYQESPMRVESSTMSDPSCGLHRAALGEECLDDECEDEEKIKEHHGRREEEERMTQSPDTLLGSINLHMELATKKREVSHLVDEMQRLQSSINNLKEISTSKISQLQDMVTEKDRVIKDLAEKLLRQQDYTDLKRELRLLKALDMGGWQSWGNDQVDTGSPANEKTPSEPTETNGARLTPPSEDESGGGIEEPASASTPPSVSSVADPVDTVSTEQLQRCLRINVDRFCGEPLNTLTISRCVRELLSVNNIGQRLFAKLVLGLSQGTVSELLSKPKPWDKLTEKGRDSYRKMHAWACDQHCVLLLKSLLPKKGRECSTKPESEDRNLPNNTEACPPPQSGTEDNNNNNTEVSQPSLPQTPHKDMRHHMHHMGHPLYTDVMNGSKAFCHYGPEFPPVMLAHIYQEELLKLIGKRMKEGQPEEQAKQAQDEIRQALAIYHRELTLLAAQGTHHPDASCHACPLHRRPDCGIPYCRDQPTCCLPHPQQQNTHEHGGFFSSDAMKVLSPYSGASPLIPLPPESQQTSNSEETSPLQRMQSITNSLLNQAATPSFSTLPQRPMKAVLPPITQQQFDHYNNLNTEDIVKRVKEQLSQYSISQRLFGESVLGLSQGSVSDLLARPKPWHMLTQKGREPFIRMKMFLEDENAVHKLVASQYKIAPERLMRMGGYGGVPLPPGSNRFSPVSSAEPTYPSHRQITSKPSHPSSPQPPSTPESPSAPMTAHSPSGSAALPSSGNLKSSGMPGRRGSRCLAPYVQPSVYEMAAVTTDLDTQIITARIKETLTVHNIGQKLFGEAVLGLSQGSVSELLSKPKPWHMLSIKGREPFIRMQLWLNDPTNVEKLQAIKTERREANKRRRNAIDTEGPSSLLPCGDQQQYPLDPLFLYPSSAKKPRILFSEEQKEALKLAYNLDPYPSTAVMEFLSSELGLSIRTITNWFHNHRMRLKQQSQEPDQPPFPPPENATSFDPIRFRLLLGQRLAEMCKTQQSAANQLLPYFSEAQRVLCPPPGLPGVPQAIDKSMSIDSDNTLDLSVSSHQYPQKEEKIEKGEEQDKRSPPPRSSSSSQATHTTAIDLTPAAEKNATTFESRISPLVSPFEYAHSTSVKSSSSLDLSFSTLQKLANQDIPSSTTNHTSLNSSSRNPSPDIEAILQNSSARLNNFVSATAATDSPVDLRDDKRPNLPPATNSGGGSNRRKAAAPQWVNPGLDLSPDSDLCGFEDEEDDDDNEDLLAPSSVNPSQVINGVCVRQTNFTSHHHASMDSAMRLEPNQITFGCASKRGEEKSRYEREQNIRRLERAISENESGWDDISDDDDEMCSRS